MLTLKVLSRALLIGLLCNSSKAQQSLYVDCTRPNDSGAGTNWATAKRTIQAAVDVVAVSGTVWVADGSYTNGGGLTPGFAISNRVVINKAITVQSVNGPNSTRISGVGPWGDGAIRCVDLGSGARLSGFTLSGGATRTAGNNANDVSSGGVLVRENAVLTNCHVLNCSAMWGGGTFVLSGAQAIDCEFASNTASNSGGGLFVSDNASISRCSVHDNVAQWGGGAFIDSGRMLGSWVDYNDATDKGGGVWLDGIGQLLDTSLTGNMCTNDGGGAYLSSGTVASNCTFSHNSGRWGAGFEICSNALVMASTFDGNAAVVSGGAGYLWHGGLVSNCIARHNLGYWGAAFYLDKSGSVIKCLVEGNGNESEYRGGGAYFSAGGTVANSIIASNHSSEAGGMYFDAGGSAINCVVHDNSASHVGASSLDAGGSVVNCTISRNMAVDGLGGVRLTGGRVYNSIIWGNGASNVVNVGTGTVAYTCAPDGITNGIGGNIASDPRFAGLTTGDVHLRADSPCLNAGNNALALTNVSPVDLDGYARINNSIVDMGAYEWPGCSSLIVCGANRQQVFSADSPDAGVGTGFGTVMIAGPVTNWLSVSNAGMASITFADVSTNNVINSPAFALQRLPTSLAPGAVSNAALVFNPATVGIFSSTLTISNSSPISPFSLNLSGWRVVTNGPSPFGITISGNLDYGNQPIGYSFARTTTVSSGSSTLCVSRIVYPQGFTGSWSTNTIPPNSTTNLVVTFSPISTQSYGGTISFECSATSGAATISCTATGVAQSRVLSFSTQYNLSFGRVFLGYQGDQWLTISNNGNCPVTFSSVLFNTGDYWGEAADTNFGGNGAMTVPAGGSASWDIWFRPDAARWFCSDITIYSDAPGSPQVIGLLGYGQAPVASTNRNVDLDYWGDGNHQWITTFAIHWHPIDFATDMRKSADREAVRL